MTTIKVRRATAASWAAANPTLVDGEPAFELDTGLFKLGDGVTPYSSLAFFTPGAGGGTAYTNEQAQDTVAAMLVNGTHTGISFAYDDVNAKINATATGGGTGGTTGATGPAGPQGPTGLAGSPGPAGPSGSGVGPALLGEVVMATNSSAFTSTSVSQDWAGFSKAVTIGSKPIVLRLDCHIQVSAANSVIVGVIDSTTGTAVGAWLLPMNNVGVAMHFYGESPVLYPAAGARTYRVALKATSTNGTYTGIADSAYKASLKVMEL